MVKKEESKKKEEEETDEDEENNDEDIKRSHDLVDKTNQAADRLEEQNKIMDENLTRQEQIQANNRLAGKAEAGKPLKKKETDKEYADKVMANDI